MTNAEYNTLEWLRSETHANSTIISSNYREAIELLAHRNTEGNLSINITDYVLYSSIARTYNGNANSLEYLRSITTEIYFVYSPRESRVEYLNNLDNAGMYKIFNTNEVILYN